MSSSIHSSEFSFNMTRLSAIPELTHANYNEWKDDMMLTLADMRADAIVIGSDPEPQSLDFDNFDDYDDWKDTEAEPESGRISVYGRVCEYMEGYGCTRGCGNIIE